MESLWGMVVQLINTLGKNKNCQNPPKHQPDLTYFFKLIVFQATQPN